MAKRDYYEILGIAKDASEDDIKKAYRKLAVKFHPDKNPDDASAAEKFRECTEAYEILKDPKKRQQFDQFGHAAFDQGGGFGGGGFGGGGFGGFDLNDALRSFMGDFGGDSFFGDIFGTGRRRGGGRSQGTPGSNLQIKLPLTYQEIHDGCKKTLKVRHKATCGTCSGTGSKSGKPENCSHCGGSGRVRKVANSIFGQVMQEAVCPACQGEGRMVKDPCSDCGGSGRTIAQDTVTVDIPAGVAEGNYITVQGKGDAGLHGGQPGDLLVVISEIEHEIFERHGIDVVTEMEITFSEAALGCEKTIETFSGKIKLKVNAGTQSGKVLKVGGKGFPVLNHAGHKGDLLIKVQVVTPQKLTKEDRALFEKLADLEEKPKNLFEKMKSMFN